MSRCIHAHRRTLQYGVCPAGGETLAERRGWGLSPTHFLVVWVDGDSVMRALPGRHTELEAMRLALSLSTYSVSVN